jgi:superfamily I DNA and/or RNA helicase
MVLVGDPMQLPPISVSEQAQAREFLEKDIFTFLSGADSPDALFKWHDSYPDFTSFFDMQYRLNADLADLISTTFYEGRLKTAALKIANHANVTRSFTVVNTQLYKPEIKKKEGEGFKPVNSVHISVVADLIEQDLIQRIIASEIGIIVPFRSVVWEYRKQLRNLGLSEIEVGTIHTFQGQEKSVIIFDTVMSSDAGRHYSVRPFDETKSGLQVPRLLNVAFSRSKHQFFVIADMSHIDRVYKNKFLGKLLTKML